MAEALRDWLPQIINSIKPWLSSADMGKGARWSPEIASKLASTRAGIICLTPTNLHSDWILFEAGALSKTVTEAYVCPLLTGLTSSQVTGPLAQFQSTIADDDADVFKLIKTLNSALADQARPEEQLHQAFKVWWPILKDRLSKVPDEPGALLAPRPERDLLEEMLALVRNLNRQKEARIDLGFEKDFLGFRLKSIQRAVRRIDRDAIENSFHQDPSGILCSIGRGDGSNYSFLVPNDVSVEDVERAVEGIVRDLTKSH